MPEDPDPIKIMRTVIDVYGPAAAVEAVHMELIERIESGELTREQDRLYTDALDHLTYVRDILQPDS